MSSPSSRLPNPSPSPALRPNKRLRTDSSSSQNGSAAQIDPHLLQHQQNQPHTSSSTHARPAPQERPRAPSNSFRHPSIISTAYERDQSVFYPEDEGDSQVGLDLDGDEEEDDEEGSVVGTVTGKAGKGANGRKGKGGIRPLAVTCTHCRARKIKCDNGKPACTNCLKAGNECLYLAKQKPGLKAGTGETMLKRIDQLEADFHKHIALTDLRMNELEAWRRAMNAAGSNAALLNPNSNNDGNVNMSSHSPSSGGGFAQPLPSGSTNMSLIESRGSGGGPAGSISGGGGEISFSPMFGFNSNPSPGGAGPGPSTLGMRGSIASQGQGGGGLSPMGPPMGITSMPTNIQNLINPNFSNQDQGGSGPGSGGQEQYNYIGGGAEDNGDTGMGGYDDAIWMEGWTLPRDDIVRDLVDLYFRKVALATFIYIQRSDETWEAPWNVVVHGMVVLAIRFSTDPRVLEYKEKIHAAAKRYVFLEAMEQTSVETLQALALVSLDVIGSGKGPENWGCLALLTRSAVTTDLLRESGSDMVEPTNTNNNYGAMNAAAQQRLPSVLSKTTIINTSSSWKEDEARRRLFWLIFALDRYTCSTTAIDAAIPIQDVKRRLPCADELWRGEDYFLADTFISPLNLYGRNSASLATLHPAAFFVEALDLLGRAHALQSRPVDMSDARAMDIRKDATAAICSSATRWYMDIQPAIGRLEADGPMAPLNVLIHGLYHATILKLQSLHAYPALATSTAIVEPYASACMTSARAITKLSCRATSVSSLDAPSVSPIFIWCCWVAARVLFVNSCLAAQINIEPEFKVIVGSMTAMAENWQLADEYVKLLLRAERKWHALAIDMNNSPASGSLSEAVSVLLDLKKTGAQALRVGKYDVTPPEPTRMADMGPFGASTPNWPRVGGGGGVAASAAVYGDVQNWFDSLELFASPSGFGGMI